MTAAPAPSNCRQSRGQASRKGEGVPYRPTEWAFPIVATGDEDGTVQIECEITEAGPVLSVRKLGRRHAIHRCVIDQRFDLKSMANELLDGLGAYPILASHGFTSVFTAVGFSNH